MNADQLRDLEQRLANAESLASMRAARIAELEKELATVRAEAASLRSKTKPKQEK